MATSATNLSYGSELLHTTPTIDESSRFFTNNLQDDKPPCTDEELRARVSAITPRVLRLLQQEAKAMSSPGCYVGVGGLSHVLLKAAQYMEEGDLEREACLKKAMNLLNASENAFSPTRFTFLEGSAGNYALKAVVAHELENEAVVSTYLKKVASVADKVSRLPAKDCDLLYGRAGYLYAIYYLRKELKRSDLFENECVAIIKQLWEEGVRTGRDKSHYNLPLLYSWHNKHYLGAAHGIVGILQVLLLLKSSAVKAVGKEAFRSKINGTIEALMSYYRTASGNLKSSILSPDDKLVQWCHGAPGCVMMLAKAGKKFPTESEKYLTYAREMGDIVWQRGLLKKGLGLCHGIAGNGYALLSLYRTTKETKWLWRAQNMAIFGLEQYAQLVTVPDRPFSLFEGIGGFLCFLMDAAYQRDWGFPGYE